MAETTTDNVVITFTAQYQQFVNSLNVMTGALDKSTASFEKLSTGVVRSEASILRFVASSVVLQKSFDALIKAPLKAAADFEQGFARIARLVDDKSLTGTFESSMKDLVKTLPISSEALFKFGEEALKAGANSTEMFKDITKLGAELTALDTDGNIGSLVTQIIRFTKGMGEGIEKSRDTADALSFLANKFTTSEKEILKATERFAPFAKQLGFTKDQTLALGNAMRELNIRSEAGGTVMADFLSKMLKASQTGGAELKGFADVAKMSMLDFANAIQLNPLDAMGKFLEGLKAIQVSGGDMEQTLKKIGLEGARPTIVFSQLATGLDVLKESLAAVNQRQKENITTANQAEQVWNTFYSQVQKLENIVGLLAKQFGVTLLKEITNATRELVTFGQELEKNPAFNKIATSEITVLAEKIVVLAGSFAALNVALKFFGTSFSALLISFGKFSVYAAAIVLAIEGIRIAYEKLGKTEKEQEEQLKKNAKSYETLSATAQDALKRAMGSTEVAIKLLKENIEEINKTLEKSLLYSMKDPFSKQFVDAADKVKLLKDAIIELNAVQKNTQTKGLPNEPFDPSPIADVVTGTGKAPLAALPPNELVAEAIAKATQALNALKIQENELGRTSDIISKELAIQNKLYTELGKIVPQPTAELAALSTQIRVLKDELKGVKEEFSLNKLVESFTIDLQKISIMGAVLDFKTDEQMLSRHMAALEQALEIDIKRWRATAQAAIDKQKSQGITTGVAFDIGTDLSKETKQILEEVNKLKAKIELDKDFQKFTDAGIAFADQLEDIRLKLEKNLIEPHEAAKQTMDAASASMLKFVKLNQEASEEYANAAIKFHESKKVYEDYLADQKLIEAAARARKKVENEELGILEKLRGAQEKYNVHVQALENLYASGKISLEERNALLQQAEIDMIKSTETFKHAEQLFQTVADGISDAFGEILESGKLSAEGLKNIAKSIIETLGKIIAQVVATKLILMFAGGNNYFGGNNTGSTFLTGTGVGGAPESTSLPNYTPSTLTNTPISMETSRQSMYNKSLPTTPQQQQNITIINVTSEQEAYSIAKDKNAIVNLISNDYQNRGRTFKVFNKRN